MNEDDPLRGTVAALTTQIQHEIARRVESLSAEVAPAWRRGLETGREQAHESARNATQDAARGLLEDVIALDEAARSGRLTSVLDTLAAASTRRRHAILFTVHRDTLNVWDATGRPSANGDLRSLELDSESALASAIRGGMPAAVPAEGRSASFATLAGAAPGIAIPLAIGGEVAAVLYSDRDGEAPASSDQPDDTDWHVALQVLVRHAARCLEAVTALHAARLVASQTAWLHTAVADDSDPAPQREEDGEVAQQAAHRYARLLISEIKLYHGHAIAAGRRERDLLSRLGGEIARAQALYDERVPERIRRSTDFFRAEVVKTLAGGDEGLVANQKSGMEH